MAVVHNHYLAAPYPMYFMILFLWVAMATNEMKKSLRGLASPPNITSATTDGQLIK